MQIENNNRYNEQTFYENTAGVLCQDILLKDHPCGQECLDYHTHSQIYYLKLFQKSCLNYTLSLEQAKLLCQNLLDEIQDKKMIKPKNIQQKKKNKYCPFSKTNQDALQIKKIIQKMQIQHIPMSIQSSILGMSIKKLQQIQNGLKMSHYSSQDYLFTIQEQHLTWLNEYMNYQNQEKLCSLKNVYNDFLLAFSFQTENVSLSSFRTIIKELGYTYKNTSKINFKATTKENKNKQFLYALTFLYHISESRSAIYIDESGIGNEHYNIKVWSKKYVHLKIDRAQVKQRINIIGAMGADLLIFQCVRGNVNSKLIKNFLIRLISQCNKQYGLRNYLFILDNASVHKEFSIQKEVLKYVTHIYLPPYSPQLNPIEKVWRELKTHLAKQDCRTNLKLNYQIHRSIKEIQYSHLQSYCDSVYQIVQKCLEKQDL